MAKTFLHEYTIKVNEALALDVVGGGWDTLGEALMNRAWEDFRADLQNDNLFQVYDEQAGRTIFTQVNCDGDVFTVLIYIPGKEKD